MKKKNTTIYDIAEQLGVTHATVSRALNDHPRISKATKQKVAAAAERLGYRPNYSARSFGTGRTKTIGLIVPDLTNPYYVDYLRAAEQECIKNGYSLITLESALSSEQEKACLEQMLEKRCDGVIANLMTFEPYTRLFGEFWDRQIPIFAPSLPPGKSGEVKLDGIEINLCGAMEKLVYHLAEMGHKRIVFVAVWARHYKDFGRFAGLESGFEKAGLKFDIESNTVNLFSGDQLEDGKTAVRRILESRAETTAIIGTNDLVCVGIYKGLCEMGLSVPGDVALAGCDNTWMSRYLPSGLTTIDQKTAEVAKCSVQAVLGRLSSAKWGEPKQRVIEPELIIRESTAGAGCRS